MTPSPRSILTRLVRSALGLPAASSCGTACGPVSATRTGAPAQASLAGASAEVPCCSPSQEADAPPARG